MSDDHQRTRRSNGCCSGGVVTNSGLSPHETTRNNDGETTRPQRQKVDKKAEQEDITHNDTFTSLDHKHRAEDDSDAVQRLFAQLSTMTPEELDNKAERNKEGQQKNDKEVEKERNQPQPEPRHNLHFHFSIPSPEKLPDDIRYAILRTTGGVVEIISLRMLYCLSSLIQRLYWCDTKQTVFLVPQVQLLVLPLIAEVVRWFHEEEPLKTAMNKEGNVELKGDVFFPLFMAFYKKRIWTTGCMERYVNAFAQAVNYLEMPSFLSTEAQWAADYYCSLDHG